ncbi:hypothetical protein [Brevibacillus panacihumi]|uniref:hypothetical protein n=1 Tax=Brevibacillus panacihumi TaxID=497735 RepID=UPI003D1C4F75
MLTVYQYNRLVGNVVYGYVHFYDDGKPLGGYHVCDKTGESDEKETAIEAFYQAHEPLKSLGYAGKSIKIVSDFSDYGYSILCGEPWPGGEESIG